MSGTGVTDTLAGREVLEHVNLAQSLGVGLELETFPELVSDFLFQGEICLWVLSAAKQMFLLQTKFGPEK